MQMQSSNRTEPASDSAQRPWAHMAMVAADKGLYAAHIVVMVFIVVGWIFPVTRLANFILIVLTLLSWFGLGLRHHLGYCLLTGMQSKIRQRLGRKEMHSFVLDFFERVTGRTLNPKRVDIAAQAVTYLCALISLYVNFGYRWF